MVRIATFCTLLDQTTHLTRVPKTITCHHSCLLVRILLMVITNNHPQSTVNLAMNQKVYHSNKLLVEEYPLYLLISLMDLKASSMLPTVEW